MSIGKATTLVVLVAAFTSQAAAQGGGLNLEDKTPLTISGFAVALGSYDRNLAQNTALASKLAVSFFRPWSDQLYLFGQLTTHLEEADSGPPKTAIAIDNLIINWTPARISALTLSFGRFDAPVGFERDDEPLNLVPTTSFTFENARPVKLTGLVARYALNPKVSLLGLVANGWDQERDNNSGKTGGLKVQVFPTSGLAVAAGALYGPEEDSTNGSQRTLVTGDATCWTIPTAREPGPHRSSVRSRFRRGTSTAKRRKVCSRTSSSRRSACRRSRSVQRYASITRTSRCSRKRTAVSLGRT